MRIGKIQIKNFKSLVDFELENLKPFCAFVGPNASGKSNIFEALELINFLYRFSFDAPSFFGGKSILSFNPIQREKTSRDFIYLNLIFNDNVNVTYLFDFYSVADLENKISFQSPSTSDYESTQFLNKQFIFKSDWDEIERKIKEWKDIGKRYENDFEIFFDNFSRIFIGNSKLERPPSINKLHIDTSNLSQIIGQIFKDESKRVDFIEWLRILIPEFQDMDVKQSNIDGSFEFFIYEKSSNKPFPKYLISDGTYNILALMAAVYQTENPQFLCIEEPENGLHPQAIELLVDFFREKCEEKDHHIWLNTHSQTLVRCLNIDEVVLVNKVNGETRAKQLTKEDNISIKTDEAWLTNALGGGVLWSK